MIAAISAVLPASCAARTPAGKPATTASRTGWAFQPMPNLNRDIRQAIGKARAGWTFAVICTELGYACHKGRATWDQQRLGIGLRALARESGQSVGKVRRDVDALVDLGLVVSTRPKVLHVADPATGRIVEKAKGRCESTLIYLTITQAALRPPKGQRGTGDGASVEPSPVACKGQDGTTVRDFRKQRTPDGDAVGIGTPPAGPGGRLTAAEAPGLPAGQTGGHLAAKASQEGGGILPVDAGRDEPPMPAGRIVPGASTPRRAAPPRQRPQAPFCEDHQEPRVWSGAAEEARLRMLRDMEARRAADAAQRPAREIWREMQAKAPPEQVSVLDQPPAASADDADVGILMAAIKAAHERGAA